MQTYAEIASQYKVGPGGTILSPGKFEGELAIVVALWEEAMNGCEDELVVYDGETPISAFVLTDNVIAGWPSMADYRDHVIALWETEQGFVCHAIYAPREWGEFVALCERQADHGDVW
jgi:hypothetical protein